MRLNQNIFHWFEPRQNRTRTSRKRVPACVRLLASASAPSEILSVQKGVLVDLSSNVLNI